MSYSERTEEMDAMTHSGKAKVTLPTDTQILITREFDAPAHLVYEALTTPELIKRWWAGRRGEVDEVEIDLRVGGSWRYVMTATGGFGVAFHGEYRELVPGERLVTTEVYEDPDGQWKADPDFHSVNTVTLAEADGRTTMAVLVEHTKPEHRDGHINSGMEGGMQEAYDALEEVAKSLR
jgi:uncharacterized protein YndB with AHSA1/START domain